MEYCQHRQIKLLAEGSSKATINGNRTRNHPIARLTPYTLGHQALTYLFNAGYYTRTFFVQHGQRIADSNAKEYRVILY